MPQTIGEPENELLTVQTYQPYGTPYDVDGGYTRKRHKTLVDSHSSTFGWDVSLAIEAQAGGGESTGGSYVKATVTTGFHGEKSDGSSEEEGTEWEEPSTYHMTVPADQALRVVQTVKTGESQVPVTDLLELDLAFAVIDWKHLNSGSPLGGNADWKGYKDTKSRVVMVVDSLDDLRLILTGQHREYPGFKGKDWTGKSAIKSHWAWLNNPKTARSKSPARRSTSRVYGGM